MYKPKNVAKFRDDSSDYPKGSSTGKGGGLVPGATGTDDRDSQPKGAELNGNLGRQDNVNEQHGQDFSLADGGMNDRLDPRQNPGFGHRTYPAAKPSLMEGD